MKQGPDIDELIAKYFANTLTSQERELLEQWENKSALNASQLIELRKIFKERSGERKTIHSKILKEKIWRNTFHARAELKIHGLNYNGVRMHYSFRKVAAVILTLIFISFLVYHFLSSVPAINKGEKISERVYKENPAGQKTKVFLSDGSVVWLNANSSISYFKHFSDTARVLHLNGEAFFEIAKDTLRPFYVQSGNVEVIVLGTKFNVDAQEAEPYVTIALTEGLVKVRDHRMPKDSNSMSVQPGQGVKVPQNGGSWQRFSFDATNKFNPFTSWKDGILVFRGDSFDQFMEKITQWYGIEVEMVGDPPANWEIRGVFQNESLNNVLKVASYNKQFTYALERKRLVIKF
jgi:ferric-dicitrate binding protein FerR (iron transport regulator)